MRAKIQKLGRIKLLLIFTIVAVIFAEILAYIIPYFMGYPYAFFDDFIVTAVIVVIIAPILLWHILGLLFTLDELEQKMNILATYDSMTSLLHRRPFLEEAELLHANAVSKQDTYCVFIIDMDNFKNTNDTYGHAAGDNVLIKYGELVKNIFNKEGALLGRMGGEEFAIIIKTNLEKAGELAEELRERFSSLKISNNGKYIQSTISIGVFDNTPNEYLSLEEVLHCADGALYHAKAKGKNRVSVFST